MSSGNVAVASSIAEVGFCGGETSHGAFYSFDRLTQLEADAQWECEYVFVTTGDAAATREIALMLPLWRASEKRWLNGRVAQCLDELTAHKGNLDEWLFLGLRGDGPAATVRARDAGRLLDASIEEQVRQAVRARVSGIGGRGVIALWANEAERLWMTRILGPPTSELAAAPEARIELVGATPDDQYATLSRASRRVIRRDRARFARDGLVLQTRRWDEVLGLAAEMMVALSRRHGLVDHPALERRRLATWLELADRQVVAFVAERDETAVAIALCWKWKDEVTVYQVGLAPGDPSSHDAYLQTTLHAPLEWAYHSSSHRLLLGFGAATPKTRRGAVLSTTANLIWEWTDGDRPPKEPHRGRNRTLAAVSRSKSQPRMGRASF